ncbi:hypothetical protein Tco_0831040 [Tanacetum coccineum]
MSSLDKRSNIINDLYKGLNIITELLKVIKNAIKDNTAHALKQDEELATWAKSSTNMAWNLGSRLSSLERAQNHIQSSMSSLKEDTHSIKNMMTGMYKFFKGQSSSSVTPALALTHIPANPTNTASEEPLSHTEGETEEPKIVVPISSIQPTEIPPTQDQLITIITTHLESSQAASRINKGKGIVTELEEDSSKKLVLASTIIHHDPNVLITYTINQEVYHLTAEQLQAQMDKEELIKKAKEEARIFAISKLKDAEDHLLKREHTEKVKRSLELRLHKFENYMWTINNRLKPETITDIRIHPKTKPVVIIVYIGTDGRNFDVHKPFVFGAFGISKLDELREIIPKKKNTVVQDLMNSLSRRYERIRKIPKELRIKSILPTPTPAPAPEQALSKSSRKNRKHMELEP